MGACLTALNEAFWHTDKHASTTDDTGTPTRTVQHWFTRTLNNLATQLEISDTQAVRALLGCNADFSSEKFCYFAGSDFASHVLQSQDDQPSMSYQ